MSFYSLTNLQGSQTIILVLNKCLKFYSLTNLQGSQTRTDYGYPPRQVLLSYKLTRFSNAFVYNLLGCLFYSLTNLQGSQTDISIYADNVEFYSLTNLQGSQTTALSWYAIDLFYSLTNLQGSQTSNNIVRFSPNVNILVICYKFVLKFNQAIL